MWICGPVLVIALAIFAGREAGEPGHRARQIAYKAFPRSSRGNMWRFCRMKLVGDEKALGYVADGIQEALAAKLFQLKEVHVASADAVDRTAAERLAAAETGSAS